MKYLSPADIAARLGVSKAQAHRIALKCVHVRDGRLVRVPEEAFARYLAMRMVSPWDASTGTRRRSFVLDRQREQAQRDVRSAFR